MADHEKTCSDRVVVEKIMLASAKRQHDAIEAQDEQNSTPKTEDVDDVDDWDRVEATS